MTSVSVGKKNRTFTGLKDTLESRQGLFDKHKVVFSNEIIVKGQKISKAFFLGIKSFQAKKKLFLRFSNL